MYLDNNLTHAHVHVIIVTGVEVCLRKESIYYSNRNSTLSWCKSLGGKAAVFPISPVRLQALEKARQVRQAILAARGGEPLNLNIPVLIDELRNDRDDQILGRSD
jgi:hypothetical protein